MAQVIEAKKDRLLNEREAAERLGLSVKTIRGWRTKGGPLPYIKISKACRYRESDIEALIERSVRRNTSDPGPEVN